VKPDGLRCVATLDIIRDLLAASSIAIAHFPYWVLCPFTYSFGIVYAWAHFGWDPFPHGFFLGDSFFPGRYLLLPRLRGSPRRQLILPNSPNLIFSDWRGAFLFLMSCQSLKGQSCRCFSRFWRFPGFMCHCLGARLHASFVPVLS